MEALFDSLGGWSLAVCTGTQATRAGVLQALESLVEECGPRDTCVFYFFGHGGVVEFSGLAGELADRAVFYLATLRAEGSRERVGVVDVEVSDALTRLDRICGNVTAIVDCCHAAGIVRDGAIPTVDPPRWAVALDERLERGDRALLLSTESHPRIVRLFGASSLRRAYATASGEQPYGLLTQRFVSLLRGADLRCDRLTWAAVAHRIREWASRERGTEEQRIVLAGPGQRLLFSRRVASLPAGAAFVPSSRDGRGWVRAGRLQGVRVGDRWTITKLQLSAELEPQVHARAEVCQVDLDHCEVVLDDAEHRLELGATALMSTPMRRPTVVVRGVPRIKDALDDAGVAHTTTDQDDNCVAIVRSQMSRPRGVEVLDGRSHTIWQGVRKDTDGIGAVVRLIEDRAQSWILERSLVDLSNAETDPELQWRWGVLEDDGELRELPQRESGAGVPRIRVGERIWVQLSHRADTPRQWFVCVLDMSIEGRLSLLNAHQPEGIEVVPGVSTFVGLRGNRRRQGLACSWPVRVGRQEPQNQHLIVLASRRPISLGHIVRMPEPDDPTAFSAQGLCYGPALRARGDADRPFVVSQGWTWGRIEFELDPR